MSAEYYSCAFFFFMSVSRFGGRGFQEKLQLFTIISAMQFSVFFLLSILFKILEISRQANMYFHQIQWSASYSNFIPHKLWYFMAWLIKSLWGLPFDF